MKAGFYLEAVTLVESLIADRLESHICSHNSQFQGFQNLGTLAYELKKNATQYSTGIVSLFPDLLAWVQDRNSLLHELSKIEDGVPFIPFSQRYAKASSCATRGLQLFNEIKAIVQRERNALIKAKTLNQKTNKNQNIDLPKNTNL